MSTEKKLDPLQVARAQSPEVVHVSVPVEVLWNFETLMNVKKQILGRLGCQACTSGFDFRFRTVQDFVVNPALKIAAVNELIR